MKYQSSVTLHSLQNWTSDWQIAAVLSSTKGLNDHMLLSYIFWDSSAQMIFWRHVQMNSYRTGCLSLRMLQLMTCRMDFCEIWDWNILWQIFKPKHSHKKCLITTNSVRFEVFPAVTIRMSCFGMLCHVALVWPDISEEPSASIIRVTRFGELETLAITSNQSMLRRNISITSNWSTYLFLCSMLLLLVTANVAPISPILVTLMMVELRSSKTSVHTRATGCNIPEHDILQLSNSYIPVQLQFSNPVCFTGLFNTKGWESMQHATLFIQSLVLYH
jgi:hypothetical protein